MGNWSQKQFGSRWRLTIFPHSHDHSHDHGHDHHHHDEPSFWGGLHHWVIGEAIGDIGAVPVTLAMQHYTPWAMKGIQNVTEPVLGPLFQWSANRYARKWAYEQGMDDHAPEAREKAAEMYQHEVEHLPHAFVWTGAAAGLNVFSQKYITRSKATIDSMVLGKSLGSIGTLITVLGLRSMFPRKVEELDEWNTKNIAEPATRWVTRKLGIDDEVVERVLEEEKQMHEGHQAIGARGRVFGIDTPSTKVDANQADIETPNRSVQHIE